MPRKRFVLIDFSNYEENELSTDVHTIIIMLTTNAATFPLLPVSVATLTTDVGTYDGILSAPVYPGQAADLAAARKVLEDDLRDNGVHINVVADGDETILAKSGYPLSKEPESQGPLVRTTMIVESVENGFNIRIAPDDPIDGRSTVPGARGYLILYVELVTDVVPPADYHQWTWAFFSKSTGQLPLLKPSTKYRLVATALGTNPSLVYSFPIDRTTQ